MQILRQLHTLHQRIQGLREDTDQGPRSLRRNQAKIEHAQKQFGDAQEAIKHIKVTIHEKEVTLKGNEQTIAKHQKQMNEASSKKEYDALRHEIDNERQANRVLEDEILEAMGQLEEKTKQLPEFDKGLQQAKADYAKAEEQVAGRQTTLEQRLAEAQTELRTLEDGLLPELKVTYQRQVQGRGPDALAPVQGRTCAGCYTEITPQNFQDLRGGRLVPCKSCGRLLYLPE